LFTNSFKIKNSPGRKGFIGANSRPHKNDLRASTLQICRMPPGPAKPPPCLLLCLRASAILSPSPAFWSPINNIWLLQPPKTFFSKNPNIVYKDTLTIPIKKYILIEIKQTPKTSSVHLSILYYIEYYKKTFRTAMSSPWKVENGFQLAKNQKLAIVISHVDA